MYAKLFAQMYDGTLCTRGPWQALVTFQQLLILADQEGNIDMTLEAISRRTTIPLNTLQLGISPLLEPDPQSRTPDEEGRRLVPLMPGREWGWHIVNYERYRQLKRESDRREYHREYWHRRKVRDGEKEKINARNALNQEIAAGRITRPDRCQECRGFNPEAHHDDYSKPLEVRWLCAKCHEKHHHTTGLNRTQQTQPSQPIAEAEAEAYAKAIKNKSTARERATRLPADFKISDQVKAWAEHKKLDHLDEHLEHFIRTAKAKGYTYVDWDQAFMNAIVKDWAGLRKGEAPPIDYAALAARIPD